MPCILYDLAALAVCIHLNAHIKIIITHICGGDEAAHRAVIHKVMIIKRFMYTKSPANDSMHDNGIM